MSCELTTASLRKKVTNKQHIKKDEMGVVCRTHGRDEKCFQSVDWKA
jgi:hypothetical protein